MISSDRTASLTKENLDMLVDFEKDYPGVVTDSNVDKILASLKKDKLSVIGELRGHKRQQKPLDAEKKKIYLIT